MPTAIKTVPRAASRTSARIGNETTKEAAPKKSIFDGFPFLDVGYVTQKKINRRLYGEITATPKTPTAKRKPAATPSTPRHRISR
jgi:hypothetical protein